MNKQRRSVKNLSIYSAANFSDQAKNSLLQRKSTIQNRAARAQSFLDLNMHDEEYSALKEKPADNFYQFARKLTLWNHRDSIKELKSREENTHSKDSSVSVIFQTESDGGVPVATQECTVLKAKVSSKFMEFGQKLPFGALPSRLSTYQCFESPVITADALKVIRSQQQLKVEREINS